MLVGRSVNRHDRIEPLAGQGAEMAGIATVVLQNGTRPARPIRRIISMLTRNSSINLYRLSDTFHSHWLHGSELTFPSIAAIKVMPLLLFGDRGDTPSQRASGVPNLIEVIVADGFGA